MPWRDAIFPAVVGVIGVLELASMSLEHWGYAAGMEVVACLFLVWRKVFPIIASVGASLSVLTLPWIGPQLDEPAMPLVVTIMSCYALARWRPDLRGIAGMALLALGLLLTYVFVDTRDHGFDDVIFVGSFIVPPFWFGRITRKLSVQSEQLVAQQEIIRRDAAHAERDRIARELHDIVAHSVSAMVVQTAAAQDLVRSDPERAEQVLADVADTGRRALAETGRLLHVVRDDADELGLAPSPGLEQLPALLEHFRASGLDVDLHVDDPLPTLPAGVDVSAYRVVQEALTNALKYAGDKTVHLALSPTESGLTIHASNAINGTARKGSGLGLLGMAERVSLLGGTISHGPTTAGRFELAVTLPGGAA